MSNFTPGPWNTTGVHVDRGNIQIGSPKDYIAEVYGDPNNAEAYANAKLMAAAPELLEACEFAKEFLAAVNRRDEMDISGEASIVFNNLTQAIKKAEGNNL